MRGNVGRALRAGSAHSSSVSVSLCINAAPSASAPASFTTASASLRTCALVDNSTPWSAVAHPPQLAKSRVHRKPLGEGNDPWCAAPIVCHAAARGRRSAVRCENRCPRRAAGVTCSSNVRLWLDFRASPMSAIPESPMSALSRLHKMEKGRVSRGSTGIVGLVRTGGSEARSCVGVLMPAPLRPRPRHGTFRG